LKPIARSRAAPADAPEEGVYQPDLLADDEPRYLRRQKPMEIRRRKFSGDSWSLVRRVLLSVAVGVAAVAAAFFTGKFLLYSPHVLLTKPEQIEVLGAHNVPREAIAGLFSDDYGRSVLQVPLERRRRTVEELPWVEQAGVRRILPDRIRVEIVERTPVALLRNGSDLGLIDAHGVILDRPEGQEFSFAIVTGISENLPRSEREARMRIYQEFLNDVDQVKPGFSERVSEVDLSNPKDLVTVMSGLAGSGSDPQAVTVHFGQGDFTNKFRMLSEKFAAWQASNGRIVSVDLQYARQIILNPETGGKAGRAPARGNTR